MDKYHLFFDLDRTLWDFEKNSKKALQQLFIETKLHQQIESFERFHQTYTEINALLWKKYGKGQLTKDELRDERFKKTLLKFDVFDKELPEILGNGYIELSPYQTQLLPNTHETLTYLQKLGYQMHIITNGFKEVQHIKLSQCKLTDYFDLILCSEEIGANKPAPQIFQHALQSTGAKASESVMIGDDYEVDVLGALRSGLHGIHFDPSKKMKSHTKGEWRINDLNQLPEMLPWIFK